MKETQLIRKIREQRQISQRELAKRAGTSQQQIQRLESGVSPVRLEMASKIAEALEVPVTRVFPALASVLKKHSDKRGHGPDRKELEEAGIELDALEWVIELGMRNGAREQFLIPSKEKRNLEELLFNWAFHSRKGSDIPFLWLNAQDYSVCVNLAEVVHSRLMYHAPGLPVQDEGTPEDLYPNVKVWFRHQREPLSVSVPPDEKDPNEDEELPAPMEQVLIELNGNLSDEGFVSFRDSDGEKVYLRVADVAMIAVPQWVLNPSLLDDDDDDEEPDSSEEDLLDTIVAPPTGNLVH